MNNKFTPAHNTAPLPTCKEEMLLRGWDFLDILLVSGDAYVDHPSFGIALLGRWLVDAGFRVGIVPQPHFEDKQQAMADLQCMGRPRLFTGVSAGAIDSMLAHYTAFRKKRSDDAYSPGGKAGMRPNRACITYTGLVRQAFPGMPVILGGIEASLRRASHYDFWADALRRPLLQDSKADLLAYGMGENALLAIAKKAAHLHANNQDFARQELVSACMDIAGIAYMTSAQEFTSIPQDTLQLPSHEEILDNPTKLMSATLAMENHVHSGQGVLAQPSGDRVLVINPPMPNLSEQEMDRLYALPFTRKPHPRYKDAIPAWEMIRTSITTHRGCGGGCSFCSLALHQGRRMASRSKTSILQEAKNIASESSQHRWAGSISDVGGPSANMWQATCAKADKPCARKSCLHPSICPFFKFDQGKGVALLREIAKTPGVRHVRVASGVRFDMALKDKAALLAYTSEFTGGQLKVAPEHTSDPVLDLMRKPGLKVFESFLAEFFQHSQNAGKEQYTVPYLISAFPGCTLENMQELAHWLAKRHWNPQQVQCFIPTPGTVATAMFYGEIDPEGNPLYVARSDKLRLEQHHTLLSPNHPAGDMRKPRYKSTSNSKRHDVSRTGKHAGPVDKKNINTPKNPTRHPGQNVDKAVKHPEKSQQKKHGARGRR